MDAQQKVDFNSINALAVQMQEKIASVADEYQKMLVTISGGKEAVSNGKIYYYTFKIDLNALVYDGNRDGKTELENDPGIQNAKNEIYRKHGTYNSRKKLLKTSLKLTEKLASRIYKIAKTCKETLGLDKEISSMSIKRTNLMPHAIPRQKINCTS